MTVDTDKYGRVPKLCDSLQSAANNNWLFQFLSSKKKYIYIHITLKTSMSSCPLKIDAWKMTFPFEMIPFHGTFVDFAVGKKKHRTLVRFLHLHFEKKKAKSKVNDRTWRFTSPSIQTAGGTFSGGNFFRRDKFFHLGKMFESTPI